MTRTADIGRNDGGAKPLRERDAAVVSIACGCGPADTSRAKQQGYAPQHNHKSLHQFTIRTNAATKPRKAIRRSSSRVGYFVAAFGSIVRAEQSQSRKRR